MNIQKAMINLRSGVTPFSLAARALSGKPCGGPAHEADWYPACFCHEFPF
jgi:hypothetical protein